MHKQPIWMILTIALLVVRNAASADRPLEEAELLTDGFSALPLGRFSVEVGAHTEYHYLPEAAPKGHWAVSCFTWEVGFMRAWRVRQEGEDRIMEQTFRNGPGKHAHPMVIAGDALWRDYQVTVEFAPESDQHQSGLVFRYQNDRSYYFFGVVGQNAVLKKVNHASAFHKPNETILAQSKCAWQAGQYLRAKVALQGNIIVAEFANGVTLRAQDDAFNQGKIGLMADGPTRYRSLRVTTSHAGKKRFLARESRMQQEEASLQAANPKLVLWKRMSTEGFGVGRNLRFGDLDGDGVKDVLIGQVLHHGPKDQYSEISCLTAMTFEGERLWQLGEPDAWKDHLTNDVAFQIHDLDGDGENEVIYCKDFEIHVLDGKTGQTKYRAPTPLAKRKMKFERILGDCLFFCDLRGTGHDRDIIIKDRYWNLWALDDTLKVMWTASCVTGHYPYAYDVDNDGKDEVMMGYTLFDDDGRKLWSLDGKIRDHADGVAIVRFRPDLEPRLLCAASDEGMFFADMQGKVLKHHYIGHVQNPATANFRDDLPGLESVSINFWGNQGIINFYDAEGTITHEFEPCQYGSMCLPVNWTGRSEEYFVHSPNVEEGGMYDGWGRRVVVFPDDGHPDMCNAVLDITGDCRDEVVVWDAHEIWVYTQSDNPKPGRLYRPIRNPLYNYSNYQATVSLAGWSDE